MATDNVTSGGARDRAYYEKVTTLLGAMRTEPAD